MRCWECAGDLASSARALALEASDMGLDLISDATLDTLLDLLKSSGTSNSMSGVPEFMLDLADVLSSLGGSCSTKVSTDGSVSRWCGLIFLRIRMRGSASNTSVMLVWVPFAAGSTVPNPSICAENLSVLPDLDVAIFEIC